MSSTPLRDEFGTNDDARQRFEKYESNDPLKDIPPALLNSADIFEYVRLAGMIWPFSPRPDEGKLKPASYEVDFMGELHLMYPSGKYEIKDVSKDVVYHLPKNSISFLFLETTFRLPDYIAARFNLRIKHVHAGLLLGTGPLVDPGFAGRLLIPLHNLTSEDYLITGGEGLIWVEFTKLSENKRWNPDCSREGEYRSFPKDTHRYLPAARYFEKASAEGIPAPAKSSIPEVIAKSAESAEQAASNARDAQESVKVSGNWVKAVSSIGILAIFGIVVSVYSLVQDSNKNVAEASKNISDYRENQIVSEKRLADLEKSLADIDSKLKVLKAATTGKASGSAQKSP